MLLGVGLAASDKFVGFLSPLHELQIRSRSQGSHKRPLPAEPSFILSEARSHYVAQPNLTSE